MRGAVSPQQTDHNLFDFPFLVHHVLAHYRVEFLDFHLFRHVAFVFCGRIKVPGSGTGVQFDFVPHGSTL